MLARFLFYEYYEFRHSTCFISTFPDASSCHAIQNKKQRGVEPVRESEVMQYFWFRVLFVRMPLTNSDAPLPENSK